MTNEQGPIVAILSQHNHPVYGHYSRGLTSGVSVSCQCGWRAEIDHDQMGENDFNTAPYMDEALAAHQAEALRAGLPEAMGVEYGVRSKWGDSIAGSESSARTIAANMRASYVEATVMLRTTSDWVPAGEGPQAIMTEWITRTEGDAQAPSPATPEDGK